MGAVVHAISHIVDRDLGGSASDPWALSFLAVLLLVAAILRVRTIRTRDPTADTITS